MSIARDIADDINVGNVGLPLKDSNNADVLAEDINGVVTLTADAAVIEGSSSGDLVRITQTGTGNALVVEDSTNPDSTPFVVNASGNVGIKTSSPSATLHVDSQNTTAPSLTFGATSGQIFQNENSELAIGLSNSSPFPLYMQGRTNLNAARDIVINPLGGNVGVGTDSISGLLHLSANTDDTTLPSIVLQDTGTTSTRLGVLTNRTGDINLSATSSLTDIRASVSVRDDRTIRFNTAGTERMRIDSDGSIRFGSSGNIGVIAASGGDIFNFYQNRDGATPYFYFNTSGNYGVYSDARLKENITPLSKEDATNLIKNINPVEFNWKSLSGDNTKRISGVLAQDVLAYATTEGQKNILTHWETFDESDPDCPHMGLSDHRLIPSIIGTIQHLLDELDEKTSQIEALTTRIETLESNTTP